MVSASAETPVAADRPDKPPTTTNGKRKRSAEDPLDNINSTMKDTDSAEKRTQAMADIARDLLVVLKEHDPSPASVLDHPIPSAPSQTPEAPPNKRAKLSSEPPSTIADKLTAGAYPTLNPLLADIAAVCRALLANGAQTGETQQDALVTRIVHFEEFAKDVITRERLRRADLFDFAEEFSGDEGGAKAGGKVALTVMGHHGPLFSSLQNPTPVVAEPLSRSSSTSESRTSTAPTSTCTSPKTGPLKVYRVIAPLNESNLPPLVSTVKAVASDSTKTLKRSAPEKVLTLGEAFPPVRISSLAPPKPSSTAPVGLKWGGAIGPGGVSISNTSLERPDPTGEWLTYRNHPPRDSKHKPRRGEPIRLGMGLPADFVVAYSSFAPTRDDSGAKVPTAMRNRVWWERRGGQAFRRMFGHDPGVGHLFSEYDTKPPTTDINPPLDEPDEDLLRQAIDSWEPEPDTDIPIDFRLLPPPLTPDETLAEISSLLQSLRSHQYLRLSAVPPIRISTPSSPPTSSSPTPEELSVYNSLQSRLATLISTLPPHATATIDGSPLAPLSLSSKIPTLASPIYTGTLPDAPNPNPAALAAINAAVGISPLSPAPVAMMRMNVPAPPPPQTPTRVLGAPHVSYHAHHMPSSPQQYFHGHQLPPPTVTTPHHYPSPYAPSPFPPPPKVVGSVRGGQQFHGHSMPQYGAGGGRRVNVPPPQGLAAVGVGYTGREGLRMGVQHTQASMENGVVPGGRYAGRSRR